jgi:hypothetical protein
MISSSSLCIETKCFNEHSISTNQCAIEFWCNLVTGYPSSCFGNLRGQLQEGLNKNTVTEVSELHCTLYAHHSIKSKGTPLRPGQDLRVPIVWGSQISRQSAHRGKTVSHTHRPPLLPRKYSRYSFLLEAESTPGPKCGRKVYFNEKFQWHHRELNPQPFGL